MNINILVLTKVQYNPNTIQFESALTELGTTQSQLVSYIVGKVN